MPWGYAAAAIGSSLVTGLASNSAAKMQSNATRYAADLSNQQYQQNRQDHMPWLTQGADAVGQMGAGLQPGGEFNHHYTLGDLTIDPGYQFRLNQGEQMVENSAAARGGLLSGGALKAIQGYGQSAASQEFDNAFNRYQTDLTGRYNRLAGIAGTGMTAANEVGSAGAANAMNIGQLAVDGANAMAGARMATAGSINSGLSSVGNAYMQKQMLDRMYPQGGYQPNYGGYMGGDSSYNQGYGVNQGPSGGDAGGSFWGVE